MKNQQEKIKETLSLLSLYFPESDGTKIESKADENEGTAREYISGRKYDEGKEYLLKAIKYDGDRKQRLTEEFGFLFDFEKDIDEDRRNWRVKEKLVEWRRQLWQVLSDRNSFELKKDVKISMEKSADKPVDKLVENKQITKPYQIIYDKIGKTSEIKGKELELITMSLFQKFLTLSEEKGNINRTKERHQKSGLQFGHDLNLVFEIAGNKKIKALIECKNYGNEIKLKDIADKLIAAESYHESYKIDHWILISPRADVSNELEKLLEEWNERGKYPFKVQAWTPATRISEFFGLIPDAYDLFFRPGDGESHPSNWNLKKREQVMDFWMEKLEPPLRLPNGWEPYLRNHEKLLLPTDPGDLPAIYTNHVKLRCKDETGELLKHTLEEKILDWLEKPAQKYPTIFLLGEFGDGKTVSTYILARKLAEQFIWTPMEGWIPIRFSLKDFGSKGVKDSRDFVKRRFEEFGTDIDGWHTLKRSRYKLLVILDGFDEISKKIDHKTILKNINALIDCYRNEFSDVKLLITSRKHFFENQKDKDRLIKRIGSPQLLHLAPIDKKTIERHLEEYSEKINEKNKFKKLKDYHDPIGLASKPLFLQMVKASLKELPDENLDELVLYETYTRESLKRKDEFLEDEELENEPEEIIENMLEILEEIAIKLHQSKVEFVYLSEIQGSDDVKMQLWKKSKPNTALIEDETGRVAARSLLKRTVSKNCPTNKKWPVDFCHRSMREYFVARAVCKMVKDDLDRSREFLKNHSLSHEIIFFASKIMKKSSFDYQVSLMNLIDSTKGLSVKEKENVKSLGCNAINLLYQYKEELPGNDWSNLVLDGANLPEADLSGKNFSGTWLQHGTMDNANLSNSDFSNCNLTGVRFEETSPIQSITVSSNGNIYAAYQEGSIWEWFYNRIRKPYSEALLGGRKTVNIRLIASSSSDITLLENEKLVFYDKINKKLVPKTAIGIRSNLKLVKASEDSVLLIEEDNESYYLHLFNLSEQSIIKSIPILPFSVCNNFGKKAFIIYNEEKGLQIFDLTSQYRNSLDIPVDETINCLTTWFCQDSSENYCFCFGQSNGMVQIWEANLEKWESTFLFQFQAHEKTVKDVSFIDDDHIISGGFDRKLVILNIDFQGKSINKVHESKIDMQCKGMKIQGVIRKEEHSILEKFIKKSS